MTKNELLQLLGALAADEDVLFRTRDNKFFLVDEVVIEHEEPPIHAVVIVKDTPAKSHKAVIEKRVAALKAAEIAAAEAEVARAAEADARQKSIDEAVAAQRKELETAAEALRQQQANLSDMVKQAVAEALAAREGV